MVNNKSAFLKALVFTAIIFFIGLSIGFVLESSRSRVVETAALKSEIDFADQEIRSNLLSSGKVTCNESITDTFRFADKIYDESTILENYDSSSKFTNELNLIHKRYDLLRMILWQDSINSRTLCQDSFHTLVYFYDYNTEDLDKKAAQISVSRVLLSLKYKYPEDILLIPLAANLDLDSVNLTMNHFNLTSTPSILIDEKKVVSGLVSVEELENIIFDSNKE
jgi:hypothetical protein